MLGGQHLEAGLAVRLPELFVHVYYIEAREAVDEGGHVKLVLEEAVCHLVLDALVNHLDERGRDLVLDVEPPLVGPEGDFMRVDGDEFRHSGPVRSNTK